MTQFPNHCISKEIKNILEQIISSRQITCWYKLNDDGSTEYNHYENSWVNLDKPNILCETSVDQKQWKNLNWKKKFAILYKNTIFEKRNFED